MAKNDNSESRICHWEHFSLNGNDDDNNDDIYSVDESELDEFSDVENAYEEMGGSPSGFSIPKVKLFKGIVTPGGIFPVNAGNDPADNFNIWILHTNFRIKTGDIKKIAEVDGVESIRPFSRYRVQIVIAMLFDPDIVMYNIEESLGAEIHYSKDIVLTPELMDKLDLVKSEAVKNRHWLIYILPSGHIKYTSSNEINSEIRNKMELYRSTYSVVGGYLLCSKELI